MENVQNVVPFRRKRCEEGCYKFEPYDVTHGNWKCSVCGNWMRKIRPGDPEWEGLERVRQVYEETGELIVFLCPDEATP